ncbi:MAG: hypothetical protein R2779_04535 [Crocinitomicaceae bacterium]
MLLHAYAAIDEPAQLSVTALNYVIDGTSYPQYLKIILGNIGGHPINMELIQLK